MFGGMSLDILRCTVNELGADVSGARLEDGVTPLHVAFQVGNLAFVQLLAKELARRRYQPTYARWSHALIHRIGNPGGPPCCRALHD
jgi:ankyrin repeat protein